MKNIKCDIYFLCKTKLSSFALIDFLSLLCLIGKGVSLRRTIKQSKNKHQSND